MNQKTSVYKHTGPIKNWHEGLMLGNGNFGALIYGEQNLVLSLDLISLWDNRLTEEMKEKGFNYQNMVECINNDWDEYLRLFDNCYNHPYPTKINAGSIVIDTPISKKTVFKIDIKKAQFEVQFDDNLISGFLDANHDILFINSQKKLVFSIKLPDYLYRETDGLGYDKPEEKREGEFSSITQQTKCDYSYSVLVKETKTENGFLYLVTSFKGDDLKLHKELLSNIDMLSCLQEHLKYWTKYYRQSEVVTGDNRLDKLYNFSRYFFACNSKGDYPMALEGVWTRNDGNLPPWKGDYHLDINLQMSYESYMKTGNFEEGKVLVDYLWDCRNKFKKLARTFAHSDGYFIPGVMTQDCIPLGGWPMYAINPCQGIWISTAFDNYYRYTGKLSFLKNRAYPFLRNLEICIFSLLHKDDEGYLKFDFSASPEINNCAPSAIFKTQTNFELSMLHFLYRTLIEYCEILGLDSSEYKQKQSMLRDYVRNENGEMMISKDMDYSFSHRHFSHLLMHKNLENIDPYSDKEQIRKDLDRLEKFGHDEWVAFSFTEASSLASYICDGELAYQNLYAFMDAFVNKNGFNMNMDLKNKGYSKIYSYAFTLEANLGYVRAMTDMMLRTTRGIITIFPGIPEIFRKDGCYFKNLRSFNNHKVSGRYENGKMNFEIKLSKPETIKLFNNIGNEIMLLVDGKQRLIKSKLGEIINVDAQKLISFVEQ